MKNTIITPGNKWICGYDNLKSVSEIIPAEAKPYPLPSYFFLDLEFEDHKVRFGYNTYKEALKDLNFVKEII
jgi:hypothetical protein